MLLSLRLIQYYLDVPSQMLSRRKLEPDAMRLEGVALWVNGPIRDYSLCYLIPASEVGQDFACPANIALVIVGTVDPAPFVNINADVLMVEMDSQGVSFGECFNQIVGIFNRMNRIDQELNQCLSQYRSPQKFFLLGRMLLENPVLVFDRSFYAINPDDSEGEGILIPSHINHGKILAPEIAETIKTKLHSRCRPGISSYYISPEYLDPAMMFCYYDQGGYTFTVCIVERGNPIPMAFQQLLEYYANLVKTMLSLSSKSQYSPSRFETLLKRLLQNEHVENAALEKELAAVGWRNDEHYICVTLQTNQWESTTASCQYTCRFLEDMFQESFAIFYEGSIILVVNLDKGFHDRGDIIRKLSPVLRDQMFRAGISYTFWEFSTLPSYYTQALGALEMGMLYNPNEWSYPFENYVLPYFLHYGASKINGRHLCAPSLVHLYVYDRKNGTCLLPTLNAFLKNERNATLTSQELFIHRNTLYQRLEKVSELTHLNLDNPQTRLYLLISATTIDWLGLQKVEPVGDS